jgi:hypothetical protein
MQVDTILIHIVHMIMNLVQAATRGVSAALRLTAEREAAVCGEIILLNYDL